MFLFTMRLNMLRLYKRLWHMRSKGHQALGHTKILENIASRASSKTTKLPLSFKSVLHVILKDKRIIWISVNRKYLVIECVPGALNYWLSWILPKKEFSSRSYQGACLSYQFRFLDFSFFFWSENGQ